MNAMAFISGLVVGLMVGAFIGLVTMAVMVERLIEAGSKLGKFTLILDSLQANRYVEDWYSIVASWKEREE